MAVRRQSKVGSRWCKCICRQDAEVGMGGGVWEEPG